MKCEALNDLEFIRNVAALIDDRKGVIKAEAVMKRHKATCPKCKGDKG